MTPERKVLVVDRPALRIISACATMTEVTEAGVTVVEDVRISRKPLPFPALYLLMPSKEVRLRRGRGERERKRERERKGPR